MLFGARLQNRGMRQVSRLALSLAVAHNQQYDAANRLEQNKFGIDGTSVESTVYSYNANDQLLTEEFTNGNAFGDRATTYSYVDPLTGIHGTHQQSSTALSQEQVDYDSFVTATTVKTFS